MSLLALLLSIVCCLGFVHVEIKLKSQEDEIRFLAKEAMSYQKTHLHQQLRTQHLSNHQTFGSQWKYILNENKSPKSKDESTLYDTEGDQTRSEITTAINGKQGRILFHDKFLPLICKQVFP